MKKTIFISSTFVDLKEERKKIWEILEKFDVIVKGMEQFGAQSTNPLETCMNELIQSNIYIGIIGMRFGSEEPKSKKSYTQLEYEKAVELGCEILIYITDDENYKVSSNLIQFDKIDKLNSFKKILKENHTIDTFANADDLAAKLVRKFRELITPKKVSRKKPDDYATTKQLLKSFFLVPKAYSGREIKLKVVFNDDALPASKTLCNSFNLEYGRTVIDEIDVKQPSLEFKNLRVICIEYKLFDLYMSLDKSVEYEIFANILFTEDKINSISTDFMDKIERIYHDDGTDYDPYDWEPYHDRLNEGEGQTLLLLKEIIVS